MTDLMDKPMTNPSTNPMTNAIMDPMTNHKTDPMRCFSCMQESQNMKHDSTLARMTNFLRVLSGNWDLSL